MYCVVECITYVMDCITYYYFMFFLTVVKDTLLFLLMIDPVWIRVK